MTIKPAGIISQVELWWCSLAPDNPTSYEDGPKKWQVQFRVYDRKKKNQLQKDYGIVFTENDEDEDNIYWKATVGKYAYKRDKATGEEDFNKPNKPVTVIAADGTLIDDPGTVGNGSIANLSITTYPTKYKTVSKTLIGVQLTRLVKYTPKDLGVPFTLTDDYEVIEEASQEDIDNAEDMDY